MLYVDSIITTATLTALYNMISELYREWINILSIVISANSVGIYYDWWSFDNSRSTIKQWYIFFISQAFAVPIICPNYMSQLCSIYVPSVLSVLSISYQYPINILTIFHDNTTVKCVSVLLLEDASYKIELHKLDIVTEMMFKLYTHVTF